MLSSEKPLDMDLQLAENVSLQAYNSFRFDYKAQYLATAESVAQMSALIAWAQSRHLAITLIGGGSNLLVRGDIEGLVIINKIKGIQADFIESQVHLTVGGGENWHELVRYCVDNNWYGLENLALIPGTAGAAPVQNIGAYGVEIKDRLRRVQRLHLKTGVIDWVAAEACGFAYRDSHFKSLWQGQYCILAIELVLTREASYQLDYGGLRASIEEPVSLKQVFETVCRIRQEKLPDPALLANAGSFFKNPIISCERAQQLKSQFPDMVMFAAGTQMKLAAAWLIDQAGWKGHRHQGVGVYPKQALVMVNYQEQRADALLELEQLIIDSVAQRFGVTLEREPVQLPVENVAGRQ